MTSLKKQSTVNYRASATEASRGRDTGPYYYRSHTIDSAEHDGIAVIEVETEALGALRRRHSGRFLKGPIPLDDIGAAARLPGAALSVFLAVHHRLALTREQRVRLPRALMDKLGVTKDAKARALHQLEGAGLVRVERGAGRPALIKLVRDGRPPER